jgi:Flp pilus assembly pilin Flp
MKLFNLFKAFRSDESGAVTVDWVVLTAAIVGLGIVVMTTVGGGIETLAGNIVTEVGKDGMVGYKGSSTTTPSP